MRLFGISLFTTPRQRNPYPPLDLSSNSVLTTNPMFSDHSLPTEQKNSESDYQITQVQLAALTITGNGHSTESNRQNIPTSIEELVQQLGHPETIVAASTQIRQLSREFNNHVTLVSNQDLVNGLVNALNSNNTEAVRNAYFAIRALAWAVDEAPLANTTGLVVGLVNALNSDTPKAVQDATLAIYHLALAVKNKVPLSNTPGLVVGLVNALKSDNPEAVQYAAAAICNLAVAVPFSNTTGLVDGLVNALKSDNTLAVQDAAAAICKLALTVENQVPLANTTGLVDGLVNALNTNNTLAVQYAALAVSRLSCAVDNRLALVNRNGLLEGLFDALKFGRTDTYLSVSATLTELTNDASFTLKLVTTLVDVFNNNPQNSRNFINAVNIIGISLHIRTLVPAIKGVINDQSTPAHGKLILIKSILDLKGAHKNLKALLGINLRSFLETTRDSNTSSPDDKNLSIKLLKNKAIR